MKLLCSILAVLFLVLSCIPCSDAKASIAQNSLSNQTQATKASKQNIPTEHKDDCSPLCHCSCCTVFCTISTLLVANIITKPLYADKVFAGYLQQSPIGMALPVWQPPKIATTC